MMGIPSRSIGLWIVAVANTTLVSLLLSSSYAFPQQITRIHIKSTYWGWGDASEEEVIEKKNSHYYIGPTSLEMFKETFPSNVQKEMVSDAAVCALLEAINSRIIEKPDLENLGVTQKWLNENAGTALSEHLKGERKSISQEQKKHLLTSLTDLQNMKKVVDDYYKPVWRWTDDDPGIEIVVQTDDDKVIKIVSSSQQEFMLPWQVSSVGPGRYFTWDATFSRVIAQLLPEGFVNRDRIVGSCFRQVLFDMALGSSPICVHRPGH